MKILKCPKCPCTKFNVTAHVTETWKVDHLGEFEDIVETGDEEVVHRPSISEGDYFTCNDCGADAVVIETEDK